MKGDPEERAIAVGRYIAGTGATVRAAAVVFWRKQKHHLERPGPPAPHKPRPLGPRCRPWCRKTRLSATCGAARPPA